MKPVRIIAVAMLAAACGGATSSVTPADATPTKLELIWIVQPAVMDTSTQTPKRPIALVVRAGSTTQRFDIVATTSVAYEISAQTLCTHKAYEGLRVAELYMNGGGNLRYVVERERGELRIIEETSDDGACTPGPCAVHASIVKRMVVPANATFEERFRLADPDGHETDQPCP